MDPLKRPDPMRELVERMLNLPEEELNKASHAELYAARENAPKGSQDKLAAAEHRAFAREAVSENLAMALPIAIATLGYTPYKMVQKAAGLREEGASNPSLNQLVQGLAGVGDGLKQRVTSTLKGI